MSKNVTLIQKKIGHQKVSCVALVATNLIKTLDAYCMLLLVWKHLHTLMQECVCMHASMCARVRTNLMTKRKHQMWLRPIDHYHPSKPISLCFCACVCGAAQDNKCVCVFACACTCERIFVLRFQCIVIENSEINALQRGDRTYGWT